MTTRFPDSLTGLLELVRGTRWEQVAHDETALEQLLVREMAASSDPLTKEIGSGLADGTLTWQTLSSSSGYAEYVSQSMDALRGFDFDGIAHALEAERVAADQAGTTRRNQEERDDDQPVWQGLGGRRS